MKKLTAILLAILMLIPLIVSCGGNDETTTTEIPTTEAPTTEAPTTEAPTTEIPTTEAPTTEAPTTEAPTTIDPNAPWSSKYDIRDTWSGKTLNIACSRHMSKNPWTRWSIIELYLIKEGKESGFGTRIDNAVLERQDYIENTYGVKLNFIDATDFSMHEALEAATLAGNINYDLCMPRIKNAHTIVAGGYVYDLANREFIDFENSYYEENAIKTFTSNGHTFFVTGAFSFDDNESARVLGFNKNLLGDGSKEASDELYQLVRDGKWTYDKLISYASAAYSDNGDEKDPYRYTYGADFYHYAYFYHYFGVNDVGTNPVTGKWEISLDNDRIDEIINTIISTKNSAWQDPNGGRGTLWGSTHYKSDFNNTLFQDCDLAVHWETEDTTSFTFPAFSENVGIVPFPMLNEDQGRYYATMDHPYTVLMCIPKLTQDRAMSEYFMDVLCWTGEEYTMKAYIETKKDQFKDDADIEMITDYIFPSISYDQIFSVLPLGSSSAWADDENKFDEVYSKAEPNALKTIAEWNAAWGGYTEE